MVMTVHLPDDLAARLAAEAERRGVTPDELVADVLAEHVPARRRLGFASLGRSNGDRRATEDEDMLAEGFGR